MATRKAPTGPKHDRCIGHVEHPYPAKGLLCVGAVIGEAGMVAFADHLATVRAEHRAADLAERESMHLAARPSAARKAAKTPGRKRSNLIAGAYVAPPADHSSFQHLDRVLDNRGIAELAAKYRAMRGLDVAPTFTPAPVRKAPRPVVERPEPVVAEPVAETLAPVLPVCSSCDDYTATGADGYCDRCRDAEPVEPAADTYAAAVELAETRPDPCAECGHPSHGASCATCDDAAQVGTYAPCCVAPVQRPMTHGPAMSAEERARCIVCGDGCGRCVTDHGDGRPGGHAAGCTVEPIAEPAPYVWVRPDIGTPDQRAETEAQYRAEQIAEPEPVLSAPAPVSAPAERPICPRCGQSFRVKGSGLAWHVANRPDCARVAVAV